MIQDVPAAIRQVPHPSRSSGAHDPADEAPFGRARVAAQLLSANLLPHRPDVLLFLQKTAGNAALSALLSKPGRRGGTSPALPSPYVQRCGSERHKGCACAWSDSEDPLPEAASRT